MWNPQILQKSEISKIDFEQIFSGNIPAVIITGFMDRHKCRDLAQKINYQRSKEFKDKNLKHIGPFLMQYATRKEDYFVESKKNQKLLRQIFQTTNPIKEIHKTISKINPKYSVSIAKEDDNQFSSCIIRIHNKGKSVPIHKDNIKYEGIEYGLEISNQLSCILHIQESLGGDTIIYKKRWQRQDEKFRDIEFGYSENLVADSESCRIANLDAGDLVIINPNYYHRVTEITGDAPRITLGMFLGFYKNTVVSWA